MKTSEMIEKADKLSADMPGQGFVAKCGADIILSSNIVYCDTVAITDKEINAGIIKDRTMAALKRLRDLIDADISKLK